MAIGLAILHWQAQVDGMDTGFVLGGDAPKNGAITFDDFKKMGPVDRAECFMGRRRIHLWKLDFDKARSISLSKGDADRKLVPAFRG